MKCYNHEDRDAVGICVSCKKGICRDCAIEYNGKLYCKDCFENAKIKREKKLARNVRKALLGGVCYGIADYFEIDPLIVRVLWLLSLFIPGFNGFFLVLYFLFWIILPRE